MDASSPRGQFHEDPGTDLPEYRTLSVLAVAGVATSVASLVVLIDPGLWWLPLLGAVLGAAAWHRITRDGARLVGRPLALAAVALSLAMAAAAPANRYAYHWLICREAQRVGECWLELLRRYDIRQAFQLTKPPGAAVAETAPDAEGPARRSELEAFVTGAVVTKLLALGNAAHARFERIDRTEQHPEADALRLRYQVTSDAQGQPETFTLGLYLLRLRSVQTDNSGTRTVSAYWQVQQAEDLSGRL